MKQVKKTIKVDGIVHEYEHKEFSSLKEAIAFLSADIILEVVNRHEDLLSRNELYQAVIKYRR